MNTDFYENIDLNFEKACKLAEENYSKEELLVFLKQGNIPEKQIAALKLERVDTKEEANTLISNLTGCDGKIREAVALKISTLLKQKENISYFIDYPDIFANATIDINGNICRLVIDSVSILKEDNNFCEKYLTQIINFTNETFAELDKFIFRDRKYVINKQLFKLYWCLESLKSFVNNISADTLYKILKRASEEKEYTIREKVAQILVLTNEPIFEELKQKLKNDTNYYVKEVFK